jgi:cytochrome c-type biogenesis protein CcmE
MIRQTSKRIVLLGLGLVALPVVTQAHHSAAQFDFGQTVRIEGVVKEMRVANPHIALFLEVTDDKGKRVIEYEGHSRNNVFRRGWRPEMVHEGDAISIDIAPMRTGADGGYVKTFIMKDGKEF